MSYHVEYSDTALKQLKKMDRFDARLITSWIGNYRALCIIEDDRLIIEVFSVGHRRHIYQ